VNFGIILVVKVVCVASEKLPVILVNSSEVSDRLAKGFGGSSGAASAPTAPTAPTAFTGDTTFAFASNGDTTLAFARTGVTDFALNVEGGLYTEECTVFAGVSVICRPRLFEENDIYSN